LSHPSLTAIESNGWILKLLCNRLSNDFKRKLKLKLKMRCNWRFTKVRVSFSIIFLTMAFAIASPLKAENASQPLWQIGQADNSAAEFAHAPKDFANYSVPGFFVINASDARHSWPYAQPGTFDRTWAPGTPQTFEILFGLAAVPAAPCRLVLDFVDTHSSAPPKLRIQINDFTVERRTPKGAGDDSILGDPSKGKEHIITVDIPADALRAGDNNISITAVSGSWVLWDAVTFESSADVKLIDIKSNTIIKSVSAKPVLVWHKDRKVQSVSLEIQHIGKPVRAGIRIGKQNTEIDLKSGHQIVEAYVLPVQKSQLEKIEIVFDGKVMAATEVRLNPVRQWEIHIVHQTHLDIGFTHKQEDVLKIQVEHLRTALKYIEQTKDYPVEARHQWHPEGMWAVEEFMRIASKSEKEIFIEACRNKQIHIDVLYAQAMTGMYTDEELFELMGAAKRFEKKYGVQVVSAMQSDVPGYTWGLASALAHNGVDYLSVGPNWFSKGGTNDYFKGAKIVGLGAMSGGHVFEWADQPFWWVNPSGKHKVLFWMPGWGYSGFHQNKFAISEDKVFSYLHHLQEVDYPYDMVMWRYAIGKDNGPPSLYLSNVVKAWNEKYASPRLVITNNSEVMKTFVKRYGEQIPVVKGDYTPYWEDGSASTSKATSVNRQASEKLSQVQTLWSMISPEQKLFERFDLAWNKAIMYDEHTWGAHNSRSAADSAFAIQQDKYKQAYAFDGLRLTNELLADITNEVSQDASGSIDVYNTASWQRSELVLITKEQSAAGDQVRDGRGKVVPSQRLSSGDLAFIAKDVPAFGARRYSIHAGVPKRSGSVKAKGLTMSNLLLSLEIEPQTGAIAKLRHRDIKENLVDSEKAAGLNDYLYIIGRDANKNRSTIKGPVKVTIEDAGPLVATLRIESDAPGCKKLIRRVRLIDGFDHVELTNTTDKLKERRREGLYFGFPFNIPNAVSRIDVPWAVVQVEKDQMRGANRNFYCVQRWVDMSNEDYGMTWVTVDAPLLQFDPIKTVRPFRVQQFREHIDPSAYIYSWTMNNHWECNYKADQEGLITFRYALKPHVKGYDGIKAQQFGRGICQPLIAITANPEKRVVSPMLEIDGDGIVITTIKPTRDGKDLLVRLFNTADKTVNARLKCPRRPKTIWISNPMEEKLKKSNGSVKMVKYEIVTMRISL
jgi:alpha-mannosidase